VGAVHVGEAHLDVGVTRVERVDEHLGHEVEAARALGQGPSQRDGVDAGALVVVHALTEQHVDLHGGGPGQEAAVQLAGPRVLVIRRDDVGPTDGAQDVAN
jgi:hypothetical protein